MNAGNLDNLVQIYKPIEVQDASGQTRIVYKLLCTEWSKRMDQTSTKDNERTMNAQQAVSFGLTRFVFRYGLLIDATHVIECDNVFFNIVGEPIIDGRRHFIAWNCEQRDNFKFELDA